MLRHVDIVLKMKGQEYETANDAAAEFDAATDTGTFLKQHMLCWNLQLLSWIVINNLTPETMQR